MKKSDEKLLFQYLCLSLPYGLVISYGNGIEEHGRFTLKSITSKEYKSYIEDGKQLAIDDGVYVEWTLNSTYHIDPEFVKPNLRPLSSMTDEELKDLLKIPFAEYFFTSDGKLSFIVREEWDAIEVSVEDMANVINWFIAHHFDYRGFIEKDLALVAPKDMYK